MIISFTEIRNYFVFEASRPNDPIASIKDVVVDSDTGAILAYWISGGYGLRLLLVNDVQTYAPYKILIHSDHCFQTPDSLPRLASVFEREIAIIGNRVETQNAFVGVVKNFFFNTNTNLLVSLRCKKHWFAKSQRVFRYQILSMTTSKILVDLHRTENDVSCADETDDTSLLSFSAYQERQKNI